MTDTAESEIDAFLHDLRSLRLSAGQPSFRKMAKTAHYSHTALAGALSGGRLPSRELTLAFVRACGGDQETWQARWDQTSASIDREPRPEPFSRPRRWPLPALVAAVVVAAIAGGGVTMIVMHPDTLARSNQQTQGTAPPSGVASTSDTADRPLIPGDAARFVADITIPNGLTVHTNQHFTKIWAVRNTGNVYWRNRYPRTLRGAPGTGGVCVSATRPGSGYRARTRGADLRGLHRPQSAWLM